MKTTILLTVAMILSQSILGQEILKIESKYLGKTVPVHVQKPAHYQQSKRYPLVFMLHGYSENYKQWEETANLKKLATDYQMILICPEGYVNFYLGSAELYFQK